MQVDVFWFGAGLCRLGVFSHRAIDVLQCMWRDSRARFALISRILRDMRMREERGSRRDQRRDLAKSRRLLRWSMVMVRREVTE
jgi:hypothetical protein